MFRSRTFLIGAIALMLALPFVLGFSSSSLGNASIACTTTSISVKHVGKTTTKPFVAVNETFRIYGPAPESIVGKRFKVSGQVRIPEASFSYSLEDGHNILAEGHAQGGKGGTGWTDFQFTVTLQELPTSPIGVLTIYGTSAKDGAAIHKLHIPYTFQSELVQLETE